LLLRRRGGEDARLAVSVDDRRLLEARLSRELRHVLGSSGETSVFGGDRR